MTIRSTGSLISDQSCSNTLYDRSVSTVASSCSQYACWFLLSVTPTTLTSYFSSARFIIEPQPQPTSSSVMPGFSPSLPRLRSSLAICASSMVMSSRGKYAQL